jgi:hypothetical protein
MMPERTTLNRDCQVDNCNNRYAEFLGHRVDGTAHGAILPQASDVK